MASRAKQATKLDIRNMMSAKRRSKRPTAFHRLALLLSVPLSVRVLVFGVVVVVVVDSVPAPAHNTHTHVQHTHVCTICIQLYSSRDYHSTLYYTTTYLLVHCSLFRFPLPPRRSTHLTCCCYSLVYPRARPCSRPTSTSATRTPAANRSTARDSRRWSKLHLFLRPATGVTNIDMCKYVVCYGVRTINNCDII